MTDLGTLFTPTRIAVIGATDRERSVGRALLENLESFDGEVVPVNPNRETVLGAACYPAIGAVPDAESIDLAVVAVPAAVAVDTVREVGEVGIENVVVLTAGFAEAGEAGATLEQELIAVAEEYDIALVGPNCLGVISTPMGLNATFAQGTPAAGSISLVSQSGAFVAAVLDWAAERGIGFRHVVSLGNEAVLDETDFIAEWGDDPGTDVVLAYVEDVDDGRAFIETTRAVTGETPVVAIKSGRTSAGAEAAASHTGSLAGQYQAYRAGFRQAGVVEARTIQEVFDAGRVLAGQPSLDGDEVAVVTNGGGPGVLTADLVGDSRLTLASFSAETTTRLREFLPPMVSVTNPLDVVGDADAERFRRALDAVLADEQVSCAVVLCVPTAPLDLEEVARAIVELQRRHSKPLVVCLLGGERVQRAAGILQSHEVPNYFDPSRAVTSLEALAIHRDIAAREHTPPTTFDVQRDRAREVLRRAIESGIDRSAAADGATLLGLEAMGLLEAYGIPTPAGDLARSETEAETIAREIDGPVVLKVVSPDVSHKSDVGGVEVDVQPGDAREAYRRMRDRVTANEPDARISGVYVQELVDVDASTETIVGLTRDPQFGHLLLFGLGGIFVQVFEDTAVRVAPVSEREAREMTEEIRAAPMLRGARGRPPADVDAVVEAIQRVSQLAGDFPVISELDVNPLVVSPDGVLALDLRITVDSELVGASDDGG